MRAQCCKETPRNSATLFDCKRTHRKSPDLRLALEHGHHAAVKNSTFSRPILQREQKQHDRAYVEGCSRLLTAHHPSGRSRASISKSRIRSSIYVRFIGPESSPRKRSRFFSPFKIRTEAEAYLPGCLGKVIAVPTSPGVAARSK